MWQHTVKRVRFLPARTLFKLTKLPIGATLGRVSRISAGIMCGSFFLVPALTDPQLSVSSTRRLPDALDALMIGFSLKLLVHKTTSDWIRGDGKGVLSKTCEQVVFPEVDGLDTTEGCKNEVFHLVVLRHSSAWNCPLFFDRSPVLHPSKRPRPIQGLSWFSPGRSHFLKRFS